MARIETKWFFEMGRHSENKEGEIIPVEISANYLEFKGQEYNCAFIRDLRKRKEIEKEIRVGETFIYDLYRIASAPNLSFEQRIQGFLSLGRKYFEFELAFLSSIDADRYKVIAVQKSNTVDVKFKSGDGFDLDITFCREAFVQGNWYVLNLLRTQNGLSILLMMLLV